MQTAALKTLLSFLDNIISSLIDNHSYIYKTHVSILTSVQMYCVIKAIETMAEIVLFSTSCLIISTDLHCFV